MDIPESVTELGEQLRGTDKIAPDPALFADPQVFAAEREKIFQRSMMALDHESRLPEDGHWFRCDGAPSSILVTRASGGRLHALRNVCLHAGYPVCDAEEGAADRVICPYHGWEYTLDGKLVEPELSSRIDPARLRLRSYPVCVRSGLILVDPSGAGETAENGTASIPAWLPTAKVSGRAHHNTDWNWKYLRHLLQSEPQTFFHGPLDERHELGPLSCLFVQERRAALFRIIPRFAERTGLQVIEMTSDEIHDSTEAGAGPNGIAERLGNVDRSLSWFDRGFAQWYWSLMSADA
jgi:nitrite reductase/ring-hydroxylating ferredoxin subunit